MTGRSDACAQGGWNPWAALRARPHVRLVWQRLAGGEGAAESYGHEREVVVLDPRLSRRERRAVLAHELIHLERGLLPVGANDATIAREEHQVREETVKRLVPPMALAELVARCAPDGVSSELVGEVFDVPNAVAQRALERLCSLGLESPR